MKLVKKVKNSIKKEFDSKHVYNENYLKAKVKSYNGKINTHFCNNKIPKLCSQFNCLSVLLINYVFRTSKIYYPQVFLEELIKMLLKICLSIRHRNFF